MFSDDHAKANLSRRDFIRVGAISAAAAELALAESTACARTSSRRDGHSCIVLFLVGGPSHLDTWDLKPAAPSTVRGPFKPIRTNVPGIDVAETLPLTAQHADRYAIIRSVHHDQAPIHETGHQLMQTGRLANGEQAHPHFGAVVSHLKGERVGGMPPFVLLPHVLGNTGVSVDHGQTAGCLNAMHEPFLLDDVAVGGRFPSERARRAFNVSSEDRAVRESYGTSQFGQSCLTARRLVEHGTRVVTVNAFDTVFNETTWDCHADGGALGSSLRDYQKTLCPELDRAYSALLTDLHLRGLLDTTLVAVMGEHGRTPFLNPRGGRDHWPGCWSILLAGGGVRGGQVIGASDRIGAEPRDRPVSPAQVVATIYHSLGIDPQTSLELDDGSATPLVDAQPIAELF